MPWKCQNTNQQRILLDHWRKELQPNLKHIFPVWFQNWFQVLADIRVLLRKKLPFSPLPPCPFNELLFIVAERLEEKSSCMWLCGLSFAGTGFSPFQDTWSALERVLMVVTFAVHIYLCVFFYILSILLYCFVSLQLKGGFETISL